MALPRRATPTPARRRRAFALIVSLGMLALLAVLASVFVTMARIESAAARSNVDLVRCKLVAWSGVEYALARMYRYAELYAYDNSRPLPGLPTVPFAPPVRSFSYPQEWLFRDAAGRGVGQGQDLRTAEWPSFRNFELTPPLCPPNLNPSAPSYPASGSYRPAHYLGGTYYTGAVATNDGPGDFFLLKVIDCAAQVNLNLPDTQAATLLANLNTALTLWGLDAGRPALSAADRTALLSAPRDPATGLRYTNKHQVAAALRLADPAAGAAKYERIRDFIAVTGWADRSVLRPSPVGFYDLPGAARGHTLETRWPVNVNTAHPAVLTACLMNLRGQVRVVTNGPPTPFGPAADLAMQPVGPITQNQAFQIAKSIAYRRAYVGPFRTWSEFAAFLVGDDYTDPPPGPPAVPALPEPGVATAPQTVPQCFGSGAGSDPARRLAALLFANANPNSLTSRFNPNWPGAKGAELQFDVAAIGKADLTLANATTEFCFGSMGWCEIQSIGYVLQPDGGAPPRPAAEREVTAVARIFEVVRDTTQQEFERHRTGGSNDITLPESMADVYDRTGSTVHPQSPAAQLAADGQPSAFAYDGRIEMSSEWRGTPAAGSSWYATWRAGMNSQGGTAPGAGSTKQAAPGVGAAGPPPTDPPMLKTGTDVAPDGLMCWRGDAGHPPRLLTYPRALSGPVTLDLLAARSVDFWIKFAEPGIQGNNECILYAVQVINAAHAPPANPRRGIAWKLEKFDSKLVSTRFLWVQDPPGLGAPQPDVANPWFRFFSVPPPADPRLVYQERSFDISGWRPGDWHLIHVDWTGQDLATGVSHEFQPDGQASIALPLAEVTGIPGGGLLGGARFRTNRFSLRSNLGLELLTVGGYTVPPGAGGPIYYQSRQPAGPPPLNGEPVMVQIDAGQNRFPNATIDDLEIRTAVGFAFRERFTVPSRYDGALPLLPVLGAINPWARFGTLSWSVYYPSTAPNLRVQADYGPGFGNVAVAPPADRLLHGIGWRVAANQSIGVAGAYHNQFVGAGATTLPVRVQFTTAGGGTPTATPWVDDLTLTVLNGVRLFEVNWSPE